MGDDAHEPAVFFDHRQLPHLVLGHQPQSFVEVLLWIDHHQLCGGDLAHARRAWVLALGDNADRDVTVGQRRKLAVAFNELCEADILAPIISALLNRLVGIDAARICGHELTNAPARRFPL